MRSAYLIRFEGAEGVEDRSNFKSRGSDEYSLISFLYGSIVVF